MQDMNAHILLYSLIQDFYYLTPLSFNLHTSFAIPVLWFHFDQKGYTLTTSGQIQTHGQNELRYYRFPG